MWQCRPTRGITATLGESGGRPVYSSAGPRAGIMPSEKHHIPSLTLERETGSGSSNCRLTEGSVLEEAVLSSMWIL